MPYERSAWEIDTGGKDGEVQNGGKKYNCRNQNIVEIFEIVIVQSLQQKIGCDLGIFN